MMNIVDSRVNPSENVSIDHGMVVTTIKKRNNEKENRKNVPKTIS